MNSGIGKLIGSTSYELASDELARRRPSTKPGPRPARETRATTRQPKAAPGPPQGRPSARPRLRQSWAAMLGLCARAHGAPRGLLCVRGCLCSHTKPKTYRIRLMIKFLILFDKLIK